ncbi:Sec63 Brl domain-containing protein [Aspergillus caelatus]|uniref:DNA 3'-5' helicase n=1 Tax=Aspergillus caelatus TaxID=61420 RepID=A0A5N7AFU4_9EURO|nr:Sec63 Brl domain-containing protein [Aspergillus caelatus]KAE8368724.1 Sec63 Brl domain-containing protein [Aspergillus caelatus]
MRSNVRTALDQRFGEGARNSSSLGGSRREELPISTPEPGALCRDDDLLYDAFDLELLAQSDESARTRQSIFSITDRQLHTREVPQNGAPALVSRYFCETPHITPHQSVASGSSDLEIRSPSSPLLRLQAERTRPYVTQDSDSKGCHHDHQLRLEQFEESHAAAILEQRTLFQDMPVSVRGIVLVSVHELPDKYRSLFSFPAFNAIQSKCFQPVYKRDDNIVLAAPTGSGKTVVMELAICRLLNNLKDERFKVIYQAPTKSLCSERFRDWSRKFHSLGLQCAELTGDTDYSQMRSVQNSQIIITTPEKWDSVTRKWKDHARLMQLVKLFLIDEVHILKESRGATLEAVVSRMKTIGSNVRFVALSATIPNSEDIATWLGKDVTNQHVPAHREHFGEEFRPVRLQRFVCGYQSQGNDFAFDKMCNSKLPDILAIYSCRKPIMIFCCTRNSSVATAKELARLWSMSNPPARLWKGPSTSFEFNNVDLKTTSAAGVAFHHAGLGPGDRQTIENGFLQGQINIICCTSTLAVGVNLPCHLVIIKNTVGWLDGGCKEYSDLEIMQMLGRAGRPQFDKDAVAVILTRKERVGYYERLVSGSECLESCLHLNLIDHLNAEIGLGNVTSVESAIRWLAGTFLSVRLRRNPTHYQLREGADRKDEDEMLRQICEKDIRLLQESNLTSTERLRSTQFGDAMARYYVRFETMKTFLTLKHHATMSQILSVISQAEEFRDVRLKAGEKSLYKEINRETGIMFPVKVDIALPAHKTSLLIQSELGVVEFPDDEQYQKHKFAFQQDRGFVFSHVNRLIRCIIDCQIARQDSIATRNALELARSFGAKVWDRSPFQMKQLEQIGVVAVRKLAAAGITSIEALECAEPHQIDMILSKNPPFGLKLLGRLSEFPKLRVSAKETKHGNPMRVHFKAEVAFMNEKCPATFQRRPVHVCFLAETSDGLMIDFRRMSASKVQSSQEIHLNLEMNSPDQYITCYAMCDDIAGTLISAELRPILPASLFSFRSSKESDETNQRHMMNLPRPRSNTSLRVKPNKECNPDSFGSDDSLFNDFLEADKATDWAAMNYIACPASENMPQEKTSKKIKRSKEVKDVHKAEEPTQFGNGRWSCNHKCKDKTMCKHLCCREGLVKPPRVNRKHSAGGIDRSNGLNQLTLSASIPKNSTQMDNLGKTWVQKDNTNDNGPQEMPQSSSQEPNISLRDAASEGPICPGVNNKDSSSDYGDDSFSDLPSPSDLHFGSITKLTDRSAQTASKELSLDKIVRTKDEWIYTDEPWLTLPSSLPDPLVHDKNAMSTKIAGTSRESVLGPKAWSLNGSQGAKNDNQTTIETNEIEYIGKKRRRSLTSGDNTHGKRITKRHIDDQAAEASASPSQYHGADTLSGYNQNPQPYEPADLPAIWDDIDPTLLDEFKDIVNFF